MVLVLGGIKLSAVTSAEMKFKVRARFDKQNVLLFRQPTFLRGWRSLRKTRSRNLVQSVWPGFFLPEITTFPRPGFACSVRRIQSRKNLFQFIARIALHDDGGEKVSRPWTAERGELAQG